MCGGCNVVAEGAGVGVIVARAWWVSRQARRTVTEAEELVRAAGAPSTDELVDPLPDLLRVT